MRRRLVYSHHYDFRLPLIERIHPFDGKKYSRAWAHVKEQFVNIDEHVSVVDEPADDSLLAQVHNIEYLKSLSSTKAISEVIEVPLLRMIPGSFLTKGLVIPSKYATAGTVLAAQQALSGQLVFNLGGGYHHAFADHGEGFCFFADAALAIESLRMKNLLAADDKVLMIDLDAHRGNGFESFFGHDDYVSIFDMYNMQVYPGLHPGEPDDLPYMIPMRSGLQTAEYLSILNEELPKFLKENSNAKLVFYNAGTDIIAGDKLGGLMVEYDGVRQRDNKVVEHLDALGLPTVIMTSGGYSDRSWQLIADLAISLIRGNERG